MGGYVRHWGEFELLPGVAEVLAEVKRRGYLAVIVTNQRGVGMGLMSEEDLHAIHGQLQRELTAQVGHAFDDIYVATDKDDTSGRRKPSPTMLLEAADTWHIDLSASWMIGDSASDVEAGKRAGTKTAFLMTDAAEAVPSDTLILHSIEELLEHV